MELQKLIAVFANEKGIVTRPEIRALDLVSETGELAKEVLKATEYGKKHFFKTEDWKVEMGDVLFALVCLANETETDLGESIKLALDKYAERLRMTTTMSSTL
jgi:NTP pyrophosphatase (non-canonical NTP hydrolase)